MTKYRRLDANGDMTFGRGAESFAQGVDDTRKVTRVYDAQSAFDGRTYRFTCNVQTEFGETTVEVTY